MSAKTKTQQVIAGRDRTGRFAPGHSGNPSGRPPKRPAPRKDLSEHLSEALSQEITCEGPDGKKHRITRQQLLIQTLIANLMECKPKEQMELLLKLKAIDALPAPLDEGTEGARSLQELAAGFFTGK